MMSCNDVNHICNKAQYKEASIWEKFILKMHLIYCKTCRCYSSENTKLTEVIKLANTECLDKKCKELMKKKLEEEISKQNQQ